MNTSLLRNISILSRSRLRSLLSHNRTSIPNPIPLSDSTRSGLTLRLFSSENTSSKDAASVEDVSDAELKDQILKYFKGNEESLPSIFESILRRKLTDEHKHEDNKLLRDLAVKPLRKIPANDFEQDFDKYHETNKEIDNLYDPKSSILKKIKEDEYFYMDDEKWNEIVKDGIKQGIVKDTRQCEEILEEMLNYDTLLPDDVKMKVEERFNEIGYMCERGAIEPEEAYMMFKESEGKIVDEYLQRLEAETPPKVKVDNRNIHKKSSNVPQGVGPILRWQTRVVIAPGGNSWHPKNRLVKLRVKVADLKLSKYELFRLKELVGKRYDTEKNELVITSERFEHREENRKDCLRTLLALIEEARKAKQLAEDARAEYVKEKLRANPTFMRRLRSKAKVLQQLNIDD